MAKLVLNNVTTGFASTAATNANNDAIESALENTLSRDGTTPNTMSANIDMNGYAILNQLAQSGTGFVWLGPWVTAYGYVLNNLVSIDGNTYICTVAHTSGTFSTDLAAAKWQIIAAKGDAGAGTGDMLKTENLSGLANYGTARTNMAVVGTAGGSMTGLFNQAAGADTASAATVDLTAATGNSPRITGTTATSAVTMNAGQWCLVVANAAWPLTYHATTNKITGGASYTLTAGDMVLYNKDLSGIVHGFIIKADGTAVVGSATLRSYLSGCTMSTAGSSATMSIAAGQATDSTNIVTMSIAALAKTTSAWAVGNAQGGLDTGAIANSTWYYFYAIRRTDTGVVDVVFSTSSSSPTLPTNYTQYRYIGAGKTNGSAQWTSFQQFGDDFYWGSPVLDFSAAGSTTAALLTCTLPLGRSMKAYFNLFGNGGATGTTGIYLYHPSSDALAASEGASPLMTHEQITGTASERSAGVGSCWTDTSARIKHVEFGAETIRIATVGWMDLRGKDL